MNLFATLELQRQCPPRIWHQHMAATTPCTISPSMHRDLLRWPRGVKEDRDVLEALGSAGGQCYSKPMWLIMWDLAGSQHVIISFQNRNLFSSYFHNSNQMVNSFQLQAPACLSQNLAKLIPSTFAWLLCSFGRQRSLFILSICIYIPEIILDLKKKKNLGLKLTMKTICFHETLI